MKKNIGKKVITVPYVKCCCSNLNGFHSNLRWVSSGDIMPAPTNYATNEEYYISYIFSNVFK